MILLEEEGESRIGITTQERASNRSHPKRTSRATNRQLACQGEMQRKTTRFFALIPSHHHLEIFCPRATKRNSSQGTGLHGELYLWPAWEKNTLPPWNPTENPLFICFFPCIPVVGFTSRENLCWSVAFIAFDAGGKNYCIDTCKERKKRRHFSKAKEKDTPRYWVHSVQRPSFFITLCCFIEIEEMADLLVSAPWIVVSNHPQFYHETSVSVRNHDQASVGWNNNDLIWLLGSAYGNFWLQPSQPNVLACVRDQKRCSRRCSNNTHVEVPEWKWCAKLSEERWTYPNCFSLIKLASANLECK